MTTTETIGCFHFHIQWCSNPNEGLDQHGNLWKINNGKAEMADKAKEELIINANIDIHNDLKKMQEEKRINDDHALILNNKLS